VSATRAPGFFGTVTIGVLIGFIQYAQRFFRPIQDLSEKYNILQAAMAASERVFKLLDEQPTIVSPLHPTEAHHSGTIEFRNVWFTYQRLTREQQDAIDTAGIHSVDLAHDLTSGPLAAVEWILRGVSFSIHPSETAAIVGHTGAGKTTIISL